MILFSTTILSGLFVSILLAVVNGFFVSPGLRLSNPYKYKFASDDGSVSGRRNSLLTTNIVRCCVSPPSNSIVQEYKFESNVARVMDIIINSLYSNRDVFIRELVSNAADACDKKRYLTMTHSAPPSDLRIRISSDKANRTLTIEDNGIGMNKEDLIQNLGKIAESGTNRFSQKYTSDKDALSLIGQFGVGFYSAFLVADKMEVITKGSSGIQLRWEASVNSLDRYLISEDVSESIKDTGTRIILHLKDDADQYVDDVAVRALLEKYSEFISVPIELRRNVTKPMAMPDLTAGASSDGTIPTKTVMGRVLEWTRINEKKPVWLRAPKDCNTSDYSEFYKSTFKANEDPLAQAHFKVEGNVDFRALLFLPADLPFELSRDMFSNAARSMRLYVKRVFINDKFEDLLPRWLLFMRGVVDSDDLPLNVGREILQQSRALRIIKQRLVRKSVDLINDVMLHNETRYLEFWNNFGRYIKVGILDDGSIREDLVPLCRFYTTFSDLTASSLTSYVERMKEGQPSIYYVVGETKSQAAMSPALEKIKNKGYEVILISEPIDEMTLQSIEDFSGKKLVDVGKEMTGVNDLSEEEKKTKDRKSEDSEPLRKWIKDVLGNLITRVEVSSRLVNSPAALVQSEYGVSPSMQKYLKAQAVVENEQKEQLANLFNQAVLEINPDHEVIKYLSITIDKDPESAEAKNVVKMIFKVAALAAGYSLDNAAEFSGEIVSLMTKLYAPSR